MPDIMLQLAEEEEIAVEFFCFIPPVRGIYYAEEYMPPIIGLDKSLISDTPLLRCILAEELGHHFTTVGHHLPRQFYNYSARLATSKAEYIALRWAANYLMPETEILVALKNGLYGIWQFADYFNVTHELAKFRLKLFLANSHYENELGLTGR